MIGRSVLAHALLAVLLVVFLVAAELGLGALGMSSERLLSAVLVVVVVVPAALLLSARVGRPTFGGAVLASLVAALALWTWLMLILVDIALPTAASSTVWQMAVYNGPWPFMRLWALIAVSALVWLAVPRLRARRVSVR